MKMKVVLCLAVLCVFAVAASADFFPAFPVSSFLWAGNNYFTTQNEECLTTFKTNTLAQFVANPSQSALSSYVRSDAAAPELIVVYIEAKSSLAHSAYSFLESVISRAASSVLVPFVYRDGAVQTTSEAIATAFRATADVSAKVIELTSADISSLESAGVFSNGVVDLVIVRDAKSIVDAVDAAINTAAAGKYVALYTADAPFQREQRTPSQKELDVHRRVQSEQEAHTRALRSIEEREIVARDSDYYSQRMFWPREIWEGMMVVAILLFLLYVGFSCTFGLQTPIRWEKPKVHAQ